MQEQGPTMTPEEQNTDDMKDIDLAASMERLKVNPDFIKVFDEKFVKDYTLTQVYNLSTYTRESRAMVHEQMVSRSIFQQFVDGIIEDGKIAKDSQADLRAMEAANNVEG